MSIKIRFHGDKAIIRWKNPMEKNFLQHQLTMFRDSMQRQVQISLKDDKGREVPRVLPIQKPPVMNNVCGNSVLSTPEVISGADVKIPPQPMPQFTETKSEVVKIEPTPDIVPKEEKHE